MSNLENTSLSKGQIKLLADTLRTLSIDMVERASSGHPGMPLGIADVLTVLFTKFLRFNVEDAKWVNRDRFILSAGHGSAALYSLFYLLGHKDITLDDLKNFRQLHSKAAGHPEYGMFAATEVTTGPLGQGVANGVGMAIAEEILKARYGSDVINHKTFVLAGDGCFMEGISYEAMALAGHLGLSNLVYIYDKNNITIDGRLELAESTDFKKRFEASGFNVFTCNGHDFEEIEEALKLAVFSSNSKPSVVIAETKIGFSSPNKEGSEKAHGAPLGKAEVDLVKNKLGLTGEPFFIKDEALELWRSIGTNACTGYKSDSVIEGFNYEEFTKLCLEIKTDLLKNRSELATRQHSAKILERFCEFSKNIIGGSADLSESNGAKSESSKAIKKGDFNGNYIHYGIREHAMGAIMNGLLLHSNLKVYGSTFLVFSDYMRPPIRLSALMNIPTIYIFTHDSILVGEDGPTHQPIEHLASLRLIPNLNVIRPADSIEVLEALEVAFSSLNTPCVVVLSRQKVKENTKFREANFVKKGAYFISSENDADLTIYASGSEVSTAFEVKDLLSKNGITCSIVSFPCTLLFEAQSKEYKNDILDVKKRVFIEMGSGASFSKYMQEGDLFFGIETFGESGKAVDLTKHFALTPEQIVDNILQNISFKK